MMWRSAPLYTAKPTSAKIPAAIKAKTMMMPKDCGIPVRLGMDLYFISLQTCSG